MGALLWGGGKGSKQVIWPQDKGESNAQDTMSASDAYCFKGISIVLDL